MPILQVKLSSSRGNPSVTDVAEMLTGLTARILRKKPEVTSVLVERVDPSDWVVGGRTLQEQQKSSFFLDIKITDETNTKDEKAEYIREVFAAFGELLGDLHDESYIHVADVRAAGYGFGGLTQEARYHGAN